MDLRRSFQRFASIQLGYYDPAADTVGAPVVTGSLQVYDRFVSDRDFGVKKRLFLIPGAFEPDWTKLAAQLSVPGVFLLEGLNNDADRSGVYATVLVLREAPFKLQLQRRTGGAKRASGVGKVGSGTLETYLTTYGDFSRYSGNESTKFDNVDYTVCTWYLPGGADVDLDTVIAKEDGTQFTVKEVTTFLNLTMVRAQEQERL